MMPVVLQHCDHLQVLSSKMLDQETRYRQLTQEQLDNFTLDMNAAYARLKGMEEAIDSKQNRLFFWFGTLHVQRPAYTWTGHQSSPRPTQRHNTQANTSLL